MKVAETKGQAVAQGIKSLKNQDYLVLSADTVVILERAILGKPKDSVEAAKYLNLLSGKTHFVKTAICFIELNKNQIVKHIDSTMVEFRKLSQLEIKNYVESEEWMDKAGGYAIQGRAQEFVENLKGSLTNVVGLPIELVESVMKKHDWFKRCQKSYDHKK